MKVTERILYAYFENKATQREKLLIKQWLQEAGNEEIFYYHLSIWEKEHMQFQPDVRRAVNTYREFMEGKGISHRIGFLPRRDNVSVKVGWPKMLAVAASLTILMLTTFYFTQDYFRYTTYTTQYGVIRHILLDDGSEVTLNANSSLKVPKDLKEAGFREVWLEGEAFFEITKRPGHVRFAVHTENVNVEVLGTKFNVNSRRGNTEVVLDEGSVKLTAPSLPVQPLFMKPGDQVTLSSSDSAFKKKQVEPTQYKAWQSNLIMFEDTPLKIVAEKIEDYYGVTITIPDPELARRELTGTLPNNDLGVVLKSLNNSHNINIIFENDIIIFQ